MKMMTDTERLDYLDNEMKKGGCPNIVCDDDGRFALAHDGMQPVPPADGKGFKEIMSTVVIVQPEQWKSSIREAIDYAIENPQ
jgi:hypothetical protein